MYKVIFRDKDGKQTYTISCESYSEMYDIEEKENMEIVSYEWIE